MRILLADDHTMFRCGLRRIIQESFSDAVIEEASSCAECLQLLRADKFDLIVLDISMQGQNSLSILPDIKKLHPCTPLLMLSMHSDRQFVMQALKGGASGYLTKEHTAEELICAMNAALQGRRYVSSAIAENLLDYLTMKDSDSPHSCLSAREREVFDLLSSGRTVSEIGGILSISVKTVSTYRTRILEKMGMGSNAELMRYAVRNKLVSDM
jgi:two-component system, NarL family, invasion response regulator UvrY